jgi:two-component system sensor histidine kinase ChvG
MRSKPSMASATVIARSDPSGEPEGRRRKLMAMLGLRGSRIGRTIIALNLIGLFILVAGALAFNGLRQGLLDAQRDGLKTQGEVIASLIDYYATSGEPEPVLNAQSAQEFILQTFPRGSRLRARVFDAQGNLVVDSYYVSDTIERYNLPPLRGPGGAFSLDKRVDDPKASARNAQMAHAELEDEVRRALTGEVVARTRLSASGERVSSVSLPIQHVRAVTGVLTLQAADVNAIINKQRLALVPFILIALLVTTMSSILLNWLIAEPVRRLAREADRVRLSRARSITLPEVSRRDDELGDLARSLETMTAALSERMDAIDRFAADVAHEIRNPLTSIRSAVETLDVVTSDAAKAKLTGILKQDVSRLDRLITDISNASRLDAELSRDQPKAIDLHHLLAEMISFYSPIPPVALFGEPGVLTVVGREGPLGQVFRNLIDNARSFTSLDGREGSVRVALKRTGGQVTVTVEDDGPGIPPENLETVFERFYTSRPRARPQATPMTGIGNSGLGLSIARQIVLAHGGRIWAENRLDVDGQVLGARFTVSLPVRGVQG